MSTARQVVNPFPITTATFTGDAGVARVNTRPLQPTTSPEWWWGVAPGALLTPGNTAAPGYNGSPSATPPVDGAPAPSSDCGCH